MDMVELAHRNGVFIGVADYNAGTFVEQIAEQIGDTNLIT